VSTSLPHDCGTPLIPALHQPALVLEHARAQEVPLPEVLRGTGLCEADFGARPALLSAVQYLHLLGNVVTLLGSPETPFVLGRQVLPGHFGAASHALLQAASLRQALGLLVSHAARLSPLLVPHLLVEDRLAVLYWTDGCGLSWRRPFVVEMHMAAVVAMGRWLAGQRLPWICCFNRTRPRHTEQHEVHLGTALRFDCHVDALVIDTRWLDLPWPGAAAGRSAAAAVDRAAEQELPGTSLLAALYQHLLQQVRQPPGLDECAGHFGLSAATFKRRLAAHGTHFQAELDQVRSHVALHLFQFRGCDNDAVARHLGFHDSANFRRSFKRWTGVTPSLLRGRLLDSGPELPAAGCAPAPHVLALHGNPAG
jgi:AraC-like DNA-binding protein